MILRTFFLLLDIVCFLIEWSENWIFEEKRGKGTFSIHGYSAVMSGATPRTAEFPRRGAMNLCFP